MKLAEGPSTESLSEETLVMRRALAELGARYHRQGWLFGTSGNLSAKVGERIVVSASGRDKGRLGDEDFVEVTLEGELVGSAGGKPSAETSIHLAVYQTRPDARVALHVHTVASTLAVADVTPAGEVPRLRFTDLELIKGWGLWDEGAVADLPLFPNHGAVPRIGSDIAEFYRAHPNEVVPSLLIAGHGITAWGADAFSANRHLEVTEFLCQVALARRGLRTR